MYIIKHFTVQSVDMWKDVVVSSNITHFDSFDPIQSEKPDEREQWFTVVKPKSKKTSPEKPERVTLPKEVKISLSSPIVEPSTRVISKPEIKIVQKTIPEMPVIDSPKKETKTPVVQTTEEPKIDMTNFNFGDTLASVKTQLATAKTTLNSLTESKRQIDEQISLKSKEIATLESTLKRVELAVASAMKIMTSPAVISVPLHSVKKTTSSVTAPKVSDRTVASMQKTIHQIVAECKMEISPRTGYASGVVTGSALYPKLEKSNIDYQTVCYYERSKIGGSQEVKCLQKECRYPFHLYPRVQACPNDTKCETFLNFWNGKTATDSCIRLHTWIQDACRYENTCTSYTCHRYHATSKPRCHLGKFCKNTDGDHSSKWLHPIQEY